MCTHSTVVGCVHVHGDHLMKIYYYWRRIIIYTDYHYWMEAYHSNNNYWRLQLLLLYPWARLTLMPVLSLFCCVPFLSFVIQWWSLDVESLSLWSALSCIQNLVSAPVICTWFRFCPYHLYIISFLKHEVSVSYMDKLVLICIIPFVNVCISWVHDSIFHELFHFMHINDVMPTWSLFSSMTNCFLMFACHVHDHFQLRHIDDVIHTWVYTHVACMIILYYYVCMAYAWLFSFYLITFVLHHVTSFYMIILF